MTDPKADGLIDLDVHPSIPGTTDALFPYMTEAWRQRLEPRAKWPLPGGFDPHRMPHIVGKNNNRLTAMPPGGGGAGTDPAFVVHDLLDRHGIEAALLMCLQGSNVAVIGDRMEAAVYAAAYNDYLIEHWLGVDPRFRLAMLVAPQDPQVAVREIERTAGKRGVAGLFLPMADVPWSAASMEPILAAAQDAELPIVTHVGGTIGFVGTPLFGGTHPTSWPAQYSLLLHHAQGALAGLIWEGVFEKFPRLKFVFVEYGWTWVPPFLWRQDATWKTARRTMPWLRRAPSEYIRDQVRFTSEPALDVPNGKWETELLAQMSAERTLCFSTDYPHWDSDDPNTVFRNVAPELRQRIFRENALETFGERMLPTRQPAAV